MFVSHKRLTIAVGAITAVLAFGAPAANAKPAMTDSTVHVCNQATPTSQGGKLDATDAATNSPAARYTSGLNAKPGHGAGLVRAAANSPALSLCAEPAGNGGGGGGDPVLVAQ